MARALLANLLVGELPTPEKIRECIGVARPASPSVSDEQAEQLARQFENEHGVTMNLGATLQEDAFEEWLDEARSEIDTFFWKRYRNLLADKRFSAQVLATLDSVTDRTLGLLQDPKRAGRWDRRGMVIGHVQSGKTINYTALICKAADAGYRVIVVIAGIHNNLRSQTQRRIDEGFIGFDSATMRSPGTRRIVGVGHFNSKRRPNTFTNSLRDFDKATATSVGIPLENLVEPAVFVIKKNSSTLGNLIDWLSDQNARHGTSSISSPLLLIDDEADNASINIRRGQDEVSRINGQIRQLLSLFDRSCYVGYTATPFANIFIDPDTDDKMFGQDLFPRHFIVSLDPPNNYFGATRAFSTEDGGIVRHIEDHQDLLPARHPISHVVTALPDSLQTAVRAFIIARAIRLVRGQAREHNSMLVNVSRFTDVQRQVRNEIHTLIDGIRSSVRVNGAKAKTAALRDPEISALRRVFAEEYPDLRGISWSEIQARLWESVSAVKVVEVNSRSSGSLNYADYARSGLNVIAVGGYSLSRGLTLEGLVTSYFLRNSMMYDTLMQMGRWFGYRPGYEDLCRIWIPEEAEGWYTHITDSIEELRDELRRMETANATPEQFGLKVRSHPDTLIVTARNKMGSGQHIVVSIGLANRFIETAVLRRDEASLKANRQAAADLATNLRTTGSPPEHGEQLTPGRLVRSVPTSAVLDFLAAFQNHEGSLLTDAEPVRRYIEERRADELQEWDILFAGVESRSRHTLIDRSLGFELACQRRAPGRRSDNQTLLITNKQRVASRGVEEVGLAQEDVQRAKEEYRRERGRNGEPPNFPDRIFRNVRRKPLLIVHMLAIGQKDEDLSAAEPVVAWSISFPRTSLEERTVEYLVNTTWFRERYGEEDEDEAAGDDD